MISIILAVIFIGPIIWAIAVSFKIEGKQIVSVFDWFKPPYTLQNYPEIIMNSSVPTWLKNSLIIAVVTIGLTVIFSALAAYAIALPLSKTIISTVCIFSFIGSWNNYLWPLLCVMSESLFTLPIGIPTFAGTYTVDYVRPLTASMVASLPMIIIYVIFEKQIVAGITAGAVKG